MAKDCIFKGVVLGFCFAVISLEKFAKALNLEAAEEGVCRGLPNNISQKEFNMTWMDSVPEWYIPVGSRYEMYRIVLHRLNLIPEDEQFKSLTEDELINNGCFRVWMHTYSGIGRLYGFNKEGFSRPIFRASKPNAVDILASGPSSRTVGIGRHFVTLTDYKTFVVYSICWLETDQRSWDVLSTTKTLSSEAKQMIEEHVIELGFNPEKFISMNYESCI